MSDPFLDDQGSIEDSQPREFYRIVQNAAVTYQIASGDRDIDAFATTFLAEPIARTQLGISSTTAEFELELSLPLKHALCQRYPLQGSPPGRIEVTVWRKQLRSGLIEQVWSGLITSMNADLESHVAKFLIPSNFGRDMQRTIPTVTVGKLCPHILYDAMCRIDPSFGTFTTTTTVTSVNGRRIVVPSAGSFGDETWLLGGDLTHVESGESQTIITQSALDTSGTTRIDLQAQIPEIKTGDTVKLRAGCSHDTESCHNRFDNMFNYGGQPALPAGNMFLPNGYGVLTLNG